MNENDYKWFFDEFAGLDKDESFKRNIDQLKNKTVLELAMSLETDVLHAQTVRNDMTVYEYLRDYFGN